MQKDSRIFDDFAKLASGAAGLAADMKREIEAVVAGKVEKLLSRMSLVRREEFEVVRQMAEQARLKQEELLQKNAQMEKILESQGAGEKSHSKPSRR